MEVSAENILITDSHTVVIIDDDDVVRYTLRKKLSRFGYKVVALDKAEDALYLIKQGSDIDFIVTEIRLRKMDGIELLRHVNATDSPVPVLLMGQGNVEDAIKALRYGACDFIRKPVDANDIASIIRTALRNRQKEKKIIDLGHFITHDKRDYLLPSDDELSSLISYELTKNLTGIGICNHVTAENISLSLKEALSNAMFHGNLEVQSKIRETEGVRAYNELIEKRKNDDKYKNKRVHVLYELSSEWVQYTITDEGSGFDYHSLPDPTDPENFFKKSGRGILIMKIHMDEIEWYGTGNRIRMKKYKVE
jgi:FixJ family two-component response regulator